MRPSKLCYHNNAKVTQLPATTFDCDIGFMKDLSFLLSILKIIIFIVSRYFSPIFFRSYKVFLGLHDYKNRRSVQIVTVDETNAFPHEGYDKMSSKNDIMLLKVNKDQNNCI